MKNHVNYPSSDKTPLKIRISYFSLNKRLSEFCNFLTPKSTQIDGGNEFEQTFKYYEGLTGILGPYNVQTKSTWTLFLLSQTF